MGQFYFKDSSWASSDAGSIMEVPCSMETPPPGKTERADHPLWATLVKWTPKSHKMVRTSTAVLTCIRAALRGKLKLSYFNML
jgi:hypothetical protein